MKLFFRKYGAGPPLIILHGLYGSSDNWVTIAKNLGDNFTVYLPDQRNHGNSPHHPEHNYNNLRDDLHELADNLNLKKFFLAGHSMGGKCAISFAMKYPEMLYGLLIADISPFINENTKRQAYFQHLEIMNAMLSTNLEKISSRNDAELALMQKISSEKIRGFILKNLERTTDNMFRWKINTPALLKNLEKIMDGIDRPTDVPYQITGFPVIFLKGGNSDYLPSDDFKDIQRVFPAAELITIKDAGHWLHADQPREVVRNIKRLLADT
jgi:pimeloyl-ACP methyl ester carboxylesterase